MIANGVVLRWFLIGGMLLLLGACQSTALEITVENQSDYPICEVYISPAEATDFGENRLPENKTLLTGDRYTFLLETDEYDLLVRTCAEETIFSASQVTQSGSIVIGAAGQAALKVHNQTAAEICYLYISQNEDWGEDRLGRVESILPGSTRLFLLPPGTYRARAQDCEENTLAEIEGVLLEAPFDWTISP
ncbi:MAG: hypothetical protein AB1522_05425 [Chloroflexota bacterium]